MGGEVEVFVFKELLGDAFVEAEGAGAGAGELEEVGAALEELSDVMGEAADVGPFRAGDGDFEEGVGVAEEGDFDLDLDGLSFDGDAFAGQVVEFFTAYFFGRVHGGDLGDFSLEGVESEFDFGEGGDFVASGGDLAVEVIGVGGDAEVEGRAVLFVGGEELVAEAGVLFADEHHHDAGGEGIEGAGVADLFDAGEATEEGDEIKGGGACRFIY